MQLEDLIHDLTARPPASPQPPSIEAQTWPFATRGFEHIQTHISMLVLLDGHVFKFKKPLDLGFLNATSLERRRTLCERELAVNEALGKGVYLGLSPVLPDVDGRPSVAPPRAPADWPPDTPAIEWAVCMRRLPAERMLDALLARDAVDDALIDRIAALLSEFHARADHGPEVAAFGSPEAVAANARENFDQLEPFLGDPETPLPTTADALPAPCVPAPLHAFLRDRCERALAALEPLFRTRQADGRIRDGHGDLHAGNICCLPERLVIYDRIEFNDRFRCGDTASDLAFLAMDLDQRGARSHSTRLVDRYTALSDDSTLDQVLPFYKTYRAIVRAKVAAFASAELELGTEARAAKRAECLRYLELACRYESTTAEGQGLLSATGPSDDPSG